jgi:hypothetical protein
MALTSRTADLFLIQPPQREAGIPQTGSQIGSLAARRVADPVRRAVSEFEALEPAKPKER